HLLVPSGCSAERSTVLWIDRSCWQSSVSLPSGSQSLVVTVAVAGAAFWPKNASHFCKQAGGALCGIKDVINARYRRFPWTLEREQGRGTPPAQFSYLQSPALHGHAMTDDDELKLFIDTKFDCLIDGRCGVYLKAYAGKEHLARRCQAI